MRRIPPVQEANAQMGASAKRPCGARRSAMAMQGASANRSDLRQVRQACLALVSAKCAEEKRTRALSSVRAAGEKIASCSVRNMRPANEQDDEHERPPWRAIGTLSEVRSHGETAAGNRMRRLWQSNRQNGGDHQSQDRQARTMQALLDARGVEDTIAQEVEKPTARQRDGPPESSTFLQIRGPHRPTSTRIDRPPARA